MKRIYQRVTENTFCNFMDKQNDKIIVDQDRLAAFMDGRKVAYLKPSIHQLMFGARCGEADYYVLKELL